MSAQSSVSHLASVRTGNGAATPNMGHELEHILAGWLDRDAPARILLDADLVVYWLSSSAVALLTDGQSLVHRNGRLRPSDPRLERPFRAFTAGATASGVSTLCIADAGEHLVLSATRLHSPWEHLVGLSMRRTGQNGGVHLADLGQAFGLTPSEGRVARRLMEGMTADEAADDLGVSLDTVRTHIKRSYAKLAVTSREGFFHKLAPFVVS